MISLQKGQVPFLQTDVRFVEGDGFSLCCGAWVVEMTDKWGEGSSTYVVSSHFLGRVFETDSSEDFAGRRVLVRGNQALLLTVMEKLVGFSLNRAR